MSKNDITGDEIKSKVSCTYADNWEKIFGKEKIEKAKETPITEACTFRTLGHDYTASNQFAQCPNYPEHCFCTGACQPEWNEERIDIIGSNGNGGEHYGNE
jgi:hypothetical protein